MDIKEALIFVGEIPAQLTELRRELNRTLRETERLKQRDEHSALKQKQIVRQLTDAHGKPMFKSEQARSEEVKRRLKATTAHRRRQAKLKRARARKQELELKLEEEQRRFQAALAVIQYWTALESNRSRQGGKQP